MRRSQCLRRLTRGSAAAGLLGLRVRIPPGAWISAFCECCVFSGRGLCDAWPLVQSAPTKCGVSECDRSIQWGGGLSPLGLSNHDEKRQKVYIHIKQLNVSTDMRSFWGCTLYKAVVSFYKLNVHHPSWRLSTRHKFYSFSKKDWLITSLTRIELVVSFSGNIEPIHLLREWDIDFYINIYIYMWCKILLRSK
jgi:hypothetical protein